VVLTCSFAVFVWGICALARSAGEARDGGLFRNRTIKIQAGQHVITAADPLPDDLRQALDAINHTG
jgi:hypothetical protein